MASTISAGAWLSLGIAGLLEVAWAIGIKYTDGFTRPLPSVLTALGMIASFWFLSRALREIPVGTGYAIWTGIGAVGVAVVGIVWLGEPRTAARIVSLLLIVAGIVSLKLATAGPS
ncbi:MAG: multidrug efflux SMR transporter [Gemmatimonadaceae bacterium]|nr:multidrug efflux SMR transporter [Gemmatimonadaceae bacterium]